MRGSTTRRVLPRIAAVVALAACGPASAEPSDGSSGIAGQSAGPIPHSAGSQVPSSSVETSPSASTTSPETVRESTSSSPTSVSSTSLELPTPEALDGIAAPFGDDVVRLRVSGYVRDGWDGGPWFCLRLGEDAARTCTGGPILEIVGEPVDLDWDHDDDLVSYRAGLFEFDVDGFQVRDLALVDVPPRAAELAEQREYERLLAEFPDLVATPEISFLDDELVAALGPERAAVLGTSRDDPSRTLNEVEEFETRLREAMTTEFPGVYLEVSTVMTTDATSEPTVVVVPHSVSDYTSGIDRARHAASDPAPPPTVVIVGLGIVVH